MAPHFLRLMLGFAEPVRAKAGSVSGSEDVIECPFPKSRSLEAARRLVGCRAPLRYHHDVDQLTIRSNSARSQAQSLHTAAPELNVLQEYTTDVSKKKQPVTVYLCHVGCARRSLPLPLQIFKISHPLLQLFSCKRTAGAGALATHLFMGKRGKLGDAVERLSAMSPKVQLLAHLQA